MQPNRRPDNVVGFPYEASNVLLGRGGSGAVFLARTIGSHEMVAIKRQYTRSGAASSTASSSMYRTSTVVRRIESIMEQRSQQGDASLASAAAMHSKTHSHDGDSAVPVFARELQNEEDAREASNMEVIAYQRDECSQSLPHSQAPTVGAHDLDNQVSNGSEDELQILQCLGSHPHIVQCLGDFKSARNVSYLALELMDTDIAKEVQKGSIDLMQEDVCRVVMFSVLLALDYIHSKGVAHRDVKPGNLLLKAADEGTSVFVPISAEGSPHASPTRRRKPYQVSIGDFSAAHFIHGVKNKFTAANRGTLYYKAPEQLLSKEIHSYTACDMWALGCTMFEIATGTVAFFGKTELQVQLQIFHRMGSSFDTYPFQTAAPLLFDSMTVSPAFHDLLQHLLVLDPKARYTAKEALLHPFFTGLRLKYNEATTRLGRPAAMSFPLRLLTASASAQGKKMQVVFTPVNPTARVKQKPENGNARQSQADCVSISPIERKRSPVVHLSSPEHVDHNSLLSDGASVHWSQMRSMIGDGSSLMDNSAEARLSGESPAPACQQRSSGGAAVFSAVRRLPTPSKSQPASCVARRANDEQKDTVGSLGRSLSGSGSDNSFALPRVTFSGDTHSISVDRDHSGSVRSTVSPRPTDNGAVTTVPASCDAAISAAATSPPNAPMGTNQQLRRGRVPVLQQPAKSTANSLPASHMQAPLEGLASTVPAPARRGILSLSADALSRPQAPVAAFRGLFLGGDDHSGARDEEERPSSSEQTSQPRVGTELVQGQETTLPSHASAATTASHAFKSLQFESPRPSSGGGSSSSGGNSSRFAGLAAVTATVRPAMRPFVAPAHTVAGRSSSRHRHSGRSLPSQSGTPQLRARDPAFETPSGRSDFMVSCCSTVSCSPRATGSARAIPSARSETSSLFSDPALLATAAPAPKAGAVLPLNNEWPVAGATASGSLLPRSSIVGSESVDATATPHWPLFMPGSPSGNNAVPRYGGLGTVDQVALPRPVQLSSALSPLRAASPTSRVALADLTNLSVPPPQYDLFCVSSRHRRTSTSTKLGKPELASALLSSPTPRVPIASCGVAPASTPQASLDRETSKKRPREEGDAEAPVVRT